MTDETTPSASVTPLRKAPRPHLGRGLSALLGDAEIRHLRRQRLRKQNVMGLDIPMDNLVLVGAFKRFGDFQDILGRFLVVEMSLFVQILFEGDPVDIFHNNIVNIILDADIVD